MVTAAKFGSTAWLVANEVLTNRLLVYTFMSKQILRVIKSSITAIMTARVWLCLEWIVSLKMFSIEPLVCWYMEFCISQTSLPEMYLAPEPSLADRAYKGLARSRRRKSLLDLRLR